MHLIRADVDRAIRIDIEDSKEVVLDHTDRAPGVAVTVVGDGETCNRRDKGTKAAGHSS